VAVAADLERLGELCDLIAARGTPIVLAVIGDRPFRPVDIAAHIAGDGIVLSWCEIADDPWAAAVLAGRVGSRRRLRRSPLMLTAAAAAAQLSHRLPAALVTA
jgi:hypothetical protein